MQNKEIADIIGEMAVLMELTGENPFKCRAFQNAARLIGTSTEDMKVYAAAGTLTKLKGIGNGLAPIISDLALKGTSDDLLTLRASVPPGLAGILKVQGLGPKKVRLLYEKLGIDSLDKLRKAAEGDLLDDLAGFGGKSRENILHNISLLDQYQGKRLYRDAEPSAQAVLAKVSSLPGVTDCSLAGSLRRLVPVTGDVDILASAPEKYHRGIVNGFTELAETGRVLSAGRTRASIILAAGIQCDLRVVTPAAYPYALQYFTGSEAHNVTLRARARSLGWSLNEYGMTPAKKDPSKKPGRPKASGAAKILSPPPCRSESDIYAALGLEFIPPELREDDGEFEAAKNKRLPREINIHDIKGTFHCHTTYSDGRNSVTEMASAARDLGWQYLGIADHSKSASYAGGLSVEDVSQQAAEISNLNRDLDGFRIFAGTEVDILTDGSLDWDDRTLALFDYVVASIHSGFRMTETEATRRVIRALKNRRVTMLGHPTGRLLLQREGYPLNLRSVIDAAADYGKIIEINANPRRLDLDWSYCRYAREKGVLVSINPDAHSTAGLSDVRHGVVVARKGWLEPEDVLNTRGLAEVSRLLTTSIS